MEISRVKVKNFRNIKSEIIVDFNKLLVIIGPNNAGKTNFLKAIKLFFDSYENTIYSIDNDLPFGINNEQTSITVTFSLLEKRDQNLLKKYQELSSLLEGEKESDNNNINLYLFFSSSGRPTYRFFTNDKVQSQKREQYRNLQDNLVSEFLSKFSCKYIPSEKNATHLYEEFFLPHLRKYIGNELQSQVKIVEKALENVSENIVESLFGAGIKDINCSLSLPNNSFSKTLSKFDFFIDDGQRTSFNRKGSGIQAAISLACFNWITNQESSIGKNVIWLIEEPESYLHPALTDSCSKIIERLSSISAVFTTTHSIGFIPKDNTKICQANIIDNTTVFNNFSSYEEATRIIRKSLGVKFSDYYNLGKYNIFVEGPTDKIYIETMLSIVKPKNKTNVFPALRSANIIHLSGVSGIKDFLKSTYQFMHKERAIVVVFDGDDAGLKACKELTNYYGNKNIKFASNDEYVVLPKGFPIEILFPDEWLKLLFEEHPSWGRVENDVQGTIISLDMDDTSKKNIAEWLINKAKEETEKKKGIYDWATDFIQLFKSIDDCLIKKDVYINTL